MSLPSADTLKSNLLALKPTSSQLAGVTAFVGVIADFTNMIQAGPTGTPGILTFGNAAMISVMMSMKPVKDNSWIQSFASAWAEGISASTIAPGTVSEPVIWLGSTVDVLTSPVASLTISTIAAAKTILINSLNENIITNAPLPLATAIRSATLALTFTCIGLAAPPALTPVPIPIGAQ